VGTLETPYADLQPGDERLALTQRLDEERSAIVAQIGDLTDAQAAVKPLAATNPHSWRSRQAPRACGGPLVSTQTAGK